MATLNSSYAIAVAAALVTLPARALESAAKDDTADAAPPELQIGLQMQALGGFTQIEDLGPFAGIQLTPRLAISSSFSIGILGSLAIYVGDQVQALAVIGAPAAADPFPMANHELWRLSAEARWRWHDRSAAVVPWVGVDIGLAAARDSFASTDFFSAVVATNHSVTQYAPAIGGALGLDVALGKRVSLGAEFRLVWIGFAHTGPRLDFPSADVLHGAAYGPSMWIAPGVGTTLQIPL